MTDKTPPFPPEGEEGAGGAVQVETRLVNMYLESKNAIVNDMLEEYFTGDGTPWESASLPVSLRDVALDLVNTLVASYLSVSPG
jgi:hypothetical protein